LASSQSVFKNVQKRLRNTVQKQEAKDREESDNGDDFEAESEIDDLLQNFFSLKTQIPDAVYFCAIEPPNLSSQNAMEIALKQLQREDPSLRVSFDETTGQTVLGGIFQIF